VADAELHRADVHVGQIAVEQIGHDPALTRAKDLLGDLDAGGEGDA